MLLRFLHWAASHGWVYDCIQTAAGAKRVYSEVAARIPDAQNNPVILDIGGGTGSLRQYLGPNCRYICLDLEAPKVLRFRHKFPSGMGLLADAARLPIPDRSIDFTACTMVAHHLSEEVLNEVFRECRRVLRPGGRFVFLDWLRRPDRLPSRILWALDRGAHPYTPERLRELSQCYFEITRSDRFTILHEYLIVVLQKKRDNL
jgi:ubiquinone/menaquinone biosynthesis C-methylase UbiE